MTDKLIKLHFPRQSCRAVVLHMDQAWQDIVEHQHLPAGVRRMLGELSAAAVMLSASLKFDGALVLQIQGDGPVKLALVEVRTGLVVRATVQLRTAAENIPDEADFKSLVNVGGNGRCALILDIAGRRPGEHPYQGVVPLTGNTVAETIESYMTQSEQVRTGLWLAADDKACGGVLLQRVAATGGKAQGEIDPEGFEHLSMLARTVKNEELLTLEPEELARRLFWEDNPTVLETLAPRFGCRCSMDGIKAMVRSLGEKEAREIIEEKGKIEVRCEFCGKTYALDAIDVKLLFAPATAQSSSIN